MADSQCWLKSGSESERKSKSVKPKYGSGVIGCFVKCKKNDEHLYAVVCKHVTNHAADTFFVGEPSLNLQIARIVPIDRKDYESFTNDVDVIEIIDLVKKNIRMVYRNEAGEKRKARLYQGTVDNLYGTNVFQCYRPRGKPPSECEWKSGKVLPNEKPDGTIEDNKHFIVNGINGKPFAEAGDSGRIVAREADGYIELVGIIWGEVQSSSSPNTSDKNSVCMLLTYAFEYLNKKYNFQLSLYETPDLSDNDIDNIEPGQVVKFKIGQKKVTDGDK